LANIDGSHLVGTLHGLSPETTLFIVQSKSFNTLETLKNNSAWSEWFLHNGGSQAGLVRHFSAMTANAAKAKAFGIVE